MPLLPGRRRSLTDVAQSVTRFINKKPTPENDHYQVFTNNLHRNPARDLHRTIARQKGQQNPTEGQNKLLVFRHWLIPGEIDCFSIVDFSVTKGLDALKYKHNLIHQNDDLQNSGPGRGN